MKIVFRKEAKTTLNNNNNNNNNIYDFLIKSWFVTLFSRPLILSTDS